MVKRGTHLLLADMVTSVSDAQFQTVTRGGRWHGRYGTLSCPLCQAEARAVQNALTLADGRKGLLLHCKKAGCSFRDLTAALGISHGPHAVPDPAVIARRETGRLAEAEKRARQAQALWYEASLISGIIAETYLRGRGIICALPDTLRYHPKAWHLSGRHLPALVARVDGSDGFAVHRTYLQHDGSSKADAAPVKAMLGAVQGGAVHLTESVSGPLVVAEGIETALSLASGLLQEKSTVWAALSTSGMRALRLPPQPGRLTVAVDGDTPGRAAGYALAERAHELGWQVSILDPGTGADFNDILTGKAVAA